RDVGSFSDSRFLPESFERKEPCMTIEHQEGKLNLRRLRVSGHTSIRRRGSMQWKVEDKKTPRQLTSFDQKKIQWN
ncbi:MAG: hypothetical protein KDK54_10400, partial [Leptospiraceae bacterium]|nr:hypothetical protein [Leptospiraceae bacterium]